jgi:4'-phosphopantetheinyl transferase
MATPKIAERIELKLDQVDIWRVNLDQDEQTMKALESLLSEEELARARRLKIEDVKRRFVASRGMLRRILSRYTGEKPKDLKFQYNSNGKPAYP